MLTKTDISREFLRQGFDIGVANAYADEGILPMGAPAAHESISVPNTERFTQAFFSQPLTTYALGFRDQADLDAALGIYAPMVPVGRRFEYMSWNLNEVLLSDASTDDIRALRSDFKRVEFTSSKVNAKTENRGLTIRVDLDEVKEIPNWQELYTGFLMQRLKRSVLRRAVAALSAAATNTAVTWDTTAAVDTDNAVLAQIVTAHTAAGIRPNAITYGDTAWMKRSKGLSYPSGTNPSLAMKAGFTPDQLAAWLGVDKVFVDRARYQSAAATKAEITNNLVLIFRSEPSPLQVDPSNIKRFVSMTDAGEYKVFAQQVSAKFFDITVEHYDLIAVPTSAGVYKLTVS